MTPSVVKTTSPVPGTPAPRFVTSTRREEPGSEEQLGELQRAAVTNLELITEGSQGNLQHKLNLSDPDNLKEVRDRYFGRCYTVHPSKEVAQYGIFIMHVTL